MIAVLKILDFNFSIFRSEEKVIITKSANEYPSYSLPKDRIQKMMETPPVNAKAEEQIDPNYPYGFPTYDKKD